MEGGDPENIKETEGTLDELLKSEKESIEEAAKETDGSIDQLFTDAANQTANENNDPVKETLKKTDKSPMTPVCKFYLRGSCKHGKKGSKCSFKHPPMCFKFLRNGDRGGGCKKGKECKYTHPQMCWCFKTDKICRRKDCKFFHPKGTATDFTERGNSVDASLFQGPRVVRDAMRKTPCDRPQNTVRTSASVVNSSNSDFLELKQQMNQIQDQLRLLMGCRMLPPLPTSQVGWNQQQQSQ